MSFYQLVTKGPILAERKILHPECIAFFALKLLLIFMHGVYPAVWFGTKALFVILTDQGWWENLSVCSQRWRQMKIGFLVANDSLGILNISADAALSEFSMSFSHYSQLFSHLNMHTVSLTSYKFVSWLVWYKTAVSTKNIFCDVVHDHNTVVGDRRNVVHDNSTVK